MIQKGSPLFPLPRRRFFFFSPSSEFFYTQTLDGKKTFRMQSLSAIRFKIFTSGLEWLRFSMTFSIFNNHSRFWQKNFHFFPEISHQQKNIIIFFLTLERYFSCLFIAKYHDLPTFIQNFRYSQMSFGKNPTQLI